MSNKSNSNEKSQVSLSEREYWTEKWGISDVQLREAIERTDSLDVDKIEEFLINQKYIV